MSTLKADTLQAKTTNGTLTLANNGTGKVELPSDATIGGVAMTTTFASGATTAEKSNIMLNSFRIAEQGALTTMGMVDGVSDVFTDETGVNTGTSTDETYNAAGDYYENVGAYSAALIPTMTSNSAPSGTASASSEYSATYAAWKAFDNTVGSPWETSVANTGWLQYDFGVGNGVVVTKYDITTHNGVGYSPYTWTFEGWNGSGWDVLDTQTAYVTLASTLYSFPIANTTSYEKYRVNVTATQNAANDVNIQQLQFYASSAAANSVIVSDTFTALSQPDTAFVAVWHEDVDSVTLNTDFTIEVSRDAGTTWTAGTTALAATLSADKIITCSIDISAQPAGTSMRWRAKFLNTKSQRLRGVSMQWS